jgi:hypothetical protein
VAAEVEEYSRRWRLLAAAVAEVGCPLSFRLTEAVAEEC